MSTVVIVKSIHVRSLKFFDKKEKREYDKSEMTLEQLEEKRSQIAEILGVQKTSINFNYEENG